MSKFVRSTDEDLRVLRVSVAEEKMAERRRGRRNVLQAMDDSELIRRYRLTPGLIFPLRMALCPSTNWDNSKHCSSSPVGLSRPSWF